MFSQKINLILILCFVFYSSITAQFNWTHIQGPNESGYKVWDIARSNEKLIVSFNQGVFTYNLLTDKWQGPFLKYPNEERSYLNVGNSSDWVTGKKGESTFYLTLSDGIYWDTIPSPVNNTQNVQFLNDRIYVFAENQIGFSDDYSNWTLFTNRNPVKNYNIESINTNFYFISSPKSAGIDSCFIHSSFDEGNTWDIAYLGQYAYYLYSSQEYLFCYFATDTLKYSNDGIMWETIDIGLPQVESLFPQYDNIEFFQDKNYIYLFWPYEGLFRTTKQFLEWEEIELDFPLWTIYTTDEYIYIGSLGLWISELEQPFTNVKELKLFSNDIRLFPNPTSDLLHIDYEQQKYPDLTLKIFDSLGRLKGQYQDTELINTDGFEAGLYFVEFWSEENRIGVRKIVKL